MRQLSSQRLKDALKIVGKANFASDAGSLARDTLDAICRSLHIEKGVFMLAGEYSQFGEFKGRHIEEKYHEQFKSYYHRHDPFTLMAGGRFRKQVVSMDEIVDYPFFLSSEYYNDFLRPQKIYHKTVVYLGLKRGVSGIIALFKPRGTPGFIKEDIALLKFIAPYIAHSLEKVQRPPWTDVQEHILETVTNRLPEGLMVVDDCWNVLYATEKAERFYRTLTGSDLSRNHAIPQSCVMLTDCIDLVRELDQRRMDALGTDLQLLPKSRIIKGLNQEVFSVHSSPVLGGASSAGKRLFSVSVKELSEAETDIFGERVRQLMPLYRLTKRELEIISNVCSGLKNSDIASRLFISEITVKKHLQNIFDKLGVNNRSALICKVMTS